MHGKGREGRYICHDNTVKFMQENSRILGIQSTAGPSYTTVLYSMMMINIPVALQMRIAVQLHRPWSAPLACTDQTQ